MTGTPDSPRTPGASTAAPSSAPALRVTRLARYGRRSRGARPLQRPVAAEGAVLPAGSGWRPLRVGAPGDPPVPGLESPDPTDTPSEHERHGFVGRVDRYAVEPASRPNAHGARPMPARDGGSVATWPRRDFPVAAAQDDRQEQPGMIVQTVAVAGPKPVDIETEPRGTTPPAGGRGRAHHGDDRSAPSTRVEIVGI